jgi:hypothetical protein
MAVPKGASGITEGGGGRGDSIMVAVPVIVFTVGVTIFFPVVVFVVVLTTGLTIEDELLGVLVEGDTVEAIPFIKDVVGLTTDDGEDMDGETVVEEGATVEVVEVTTVFWSSRANTVPTAKTRIKNSKRHWILI